MACFHPRKGYRSRTVNPSGKRSVVFNLREGYLDLPVGPLPCGRCDGCKLEYSRQWAIRILHEAELHPENHFVTLTYANEHLPENGTLVKKDVQDFLKRLRQKQRYYEKKNGLPQSKIRYYLCGEYGERLHRPHYHLCLFNVHFGDLELYRSGRNRLYTSKHLEETWGKGFTSIGALNFKTAAYVARYILKKQTGPSDHWYDVIDHETGEVHTLEKEYVAMSRRPGIARDWFEKYKKEVFPNDFVVVNGKKIHPPRYYLQSLEVTDPSLFYQVKAARLNASNTDTAKKERTVERLRVREACLKSKLKLLKREYEGGP